jgi:hypothetical protein
MNMRKHTAHLLQRILDDAIFHHQLSARVDAADLAECA